MKSIDLSIVILNYNTKDITNHCIESIFTYTTALNIEILLVDNGSTDESLKDFKILAKKNKRVKLFTIRKNLGFAGGNNLAMSKALGRYVLLLNSDTYLTQDIFKPLLSWLDDNHEVGIVSCELKSKDGAVQSNGGKFPNLLNVLAWMLFFDDIPFISNFIKSFHPKIISKTAKQVDWVTGAFLLIRSNLIKQIGYLSTDFFMYVEDMEYCYRAKKANWQVWYKPQWSIVHLGGASSNSSYPIIMELKNLLLFFKKYNPAWQYSFFRLIFRLGILIRIPVFTILNRKERAYAYINAFGQI